VSDSTPLISIVIPSYNQAKYIAYNLDSILAQTYNNFEVIFIDDGSKDDTAEIVKAYTERDSRIKYFHQTNSERAVARSYGISLSQGKYVCLVDSDDTWCEDKLEKQLKVMESDKDIVLCYASVNRIDPENRPLKTASRQQKGYSGEVLKKLLMRNFIPSVTPMIRKDVLEKVGEQVTEFIPYEDWDFWLRIAKHGKFFHIEEPLGNYRLHPQQSVQNVKAPRIEEVTLKVLDANTAALLEDSLSETSHWKKIINEAYSLAYLRIAYWYLVIADRRKARERLLISLKKNPSRLLDLRFYVLYCLSYLSRFNSSLVSKFLGSFH